MTDGESVKQVGLLVWQYLLAAVAAFILMLGGPFLCFGTYFLALPVSALYGYAFGSWLPRGAWLFAVASTFLLFFFSAMWPTDSEVRPWQSYFAIPSPLVAAASAVITGRLRAGKPDEHGFLDNM